MSRYSRIFLRQKEAHFPSDSWGGGSSSKMSTVEPQSTTSPGFSYPPSTSLPSRDTDVSMKSPPPHPYTLGASHSPVEVAFRDGPAITEDNQLNVGQANDEKRETENAVGYQYPQSRRRASRHMSTIGSLRRPLPLHLRPVFVFLLYLPIPPLLSMVYMVTGHVILRKIKSSPTSIYHASLVSSLEAGATGGVILAIPIAVLLYFLFFPSKSSAEPEDFFEDDNSSVVTPERWMWYIGVLISVVFVACIGGIAGPLGVTCLSDGKLKAFVVSQKLLSASSAAAAGFLGGAIIAFGSLIWSAVGIGGMLCMRNNTTPS